MHSFFTPRNNYLQDKHIPTVGSQWEISAEKVYKNLSRVKEIKLILQQNRVIILNFTIPFSACVVESSRPEKIAVLASVRDRDLDTEKYGEIDLDIENYREIDLGTKNYGQIDVDIKHDKEIDLDFQKCEKIDLEFKKYGKINLDTKNYGKINLDTKNYGGIDLDTKNYREIGREFSDYCHIFCVCHYEIFSSPSLVSHSLSRFDPLFKYAILYLV